jgi:glutamate-5-semialdehyde dehydrogenase
LIFPPGLVMSAAMNAEPDSASRLMHETGLRLRAAAGVLAVAPAAQRNAALHGMAAAIVNAAPAILDANAADVAAYRGSSALADRLSLTPARLAARTAWSSAAFRSRSVCWR